MAYVSFNGVLKNLAPSQSINPPSDYIAQINSQSKYLLLNTEFYNYSTLIGFNITALVAGTVNISVGYYFRNIF